jgi:hypothetical protein
MSCDLFIEKWILAFSRDPNQQLVRGHFVVHHAFVHRHTIQRREIAVPTSQVTFSAHEGS